MTRKKTRKISFVSRSLMSALLVCVMLVSSVGMWASEPHIEEANDYVVTYQAEEITDIDELIQLGLQQKAVTQQNYAISPFSAEDDKQLEVKQLLEVREYEDGIIEELYLKNSIVQYDVEKQSIQPFSYGSASNSNGFSRSNVHVTTYVYFTVQQNDNPYDPLNVRLDYASVSIGKYGSVSPITCVLQLARELNTITDYRTFYCNSSSNNNFSLHSSDGGFYPLNVSIPLMNPMAQTSVTLTDGNVITFFTYCD